MSQEDQDATIGRLVRQHKDRRDQFTILAAKLKEIGQALNTVASPLLSIGSTPHVAIDSIKSTLASPWFQAQLPGLVKLVDEYAGLSKQLNEDVQILLEYGINA